MNAAQTRHFGAMHQGPDVLNSRSEIRGNTLSIINSNISFHKAGVIRELPLVLRVGEANVMNQEKDEDTERRHAAAQSKASSEIGSTSGETTF